MGESERGTVEITTQTNMQDALAGIRYLRSLGEFDKVGALGHSEGGQIVFMLGAAEEADFIISMAGPGMRGDSILVEQNRLILTKSGFTPASADNYGRVLAAMLRMKVDGYSTDSPETLVDSLITALFPDHLPRICPQRQPRPAGSAGQPGAHPQTPARRPASPDKGIPRPQPPAAALHHRHTCRIRPHRDHHCSRSPDRHRRVDTFSH